MLLQVMGNGRATLHKAQLMGVAYKEGWETGEVLVTVRKTSRSLFFWPDYFGSLGDEALKAF